MFLIGIDLDRFTPSLSTFPMLLDTFPQVFPMPYHSQVDSPFSIIIIAYTYIYAYV